MAVRCGDDTPKRDGRVTLDPMAHFEPLGTLMMLISFFYGFVIGWGRPVMVDPRNFRVLRRDDILVTAAGPAMNVLQVVAWFLVLVILRLLVGREESAALLDGRGDGPATITGGLFFVAQYGVLINLFMIAFNLIPIPPLDGSRILAQLSPTSVRVWFYQLESIGPVLLLVAINIPGFMSTWMEPAARAGFWLVGKALY
jgi:Zn-dependent protease